MKLRHLQSSAQYIRDLALPANRTSHSLSGGCSGSGHLVNIDGDLSTKYETRIGLGVILGERSKWRG
jgi:hypothetical protein